jgi:hypothetical protein
VWGRCGANPPAPGRPNEVGQGPARARLTRPTPSPEGPREMDDVSLAINLQSITTSSIWAGYFAPDFSAALLDVSITACPCRNGAWS